MHIVDVFDNHTGLKYELSKYDKWLSEFLLIKMKIKNLNVIIDCCGLFKSKSIKDIVTDIWNKLKICIYYFDVNDVIHVHCENESNIYTGVNDFSIINNDFIFIIDSIHTTGIDLIFKDTTTGIIICDINDSFRNIAQSSFRMRKIEKWQQLIYMFLNENNAYKLNYNNKISVFNN